eukprot:COSAG01_NODE_245_length_20483_cov_32.975314_5_plen_115_part_00
MNGCLHRHRAADADDSVHSRHIPEDIVRKYNVDRAKHFVEAANKLRARTFGKGLCVCARVCVCGVEREDCTLHVAAPPCISGLLQPRARATKRLCVCLLTPWCDIHRWHVQRGK